MTDAEYYALLSEVDVAIERHNESIRKIVDDLGQKLADVNIALKECSPAQRPRLIDAKTKLMNLITSNGTCPK